MVGKVEARTREALVEAIGMALSAVSARDARGFFEHRGYRAAVQLFDHRCRRLVRLLAGRRLVEL